MSNTNPKTSIIIPVYCAEHTLDRCVESALRQQIEDFEVLLVNDGSPDSSPQMCDAWAEKDKRIRVIHKQNGGLSDARNAALQQAHGKFIAFADADDTMQEGTLRAALDAFNRKPEYNIVEFPVLTIEEDGRREMLGFDERGYTDINRYWVEKQGYRHAYAWNKVYRRELFDKGICFPKGKVFEDIITTAKLLKASGNILTISDGLYHYRKNNAGITANANAEQLKQLLQWHLIIRKQYVDLPKTSAKAQAIYYMHLVNIQLDIVAMGGNNVLLQKDGNTLLQKDGNILRPEDGNILLPEERLPRSIIVDSEISMRTKLKAAFLMLFNLKCLCRIYKTTGKTRKRK